MIFKVEAGPMSPGLNSTRLYLLIIKLLYKSTIIVRKKLLALYIGMNYPVSNYPIE